MGASGGVETPHLFVPAFSNHLVQADRQGLQYSRVTGSLVIAGQCAARDPERIGNLATAEDEMPALRGYVLREFHPEVQRRQDGKIACRNGVY